MESLAILEKAVDSVVGNQGQGDRPDPATLITALIQTEKDAKKSLEKYTLSQLIGTWQLCFITGTKNSRQGIGKIFGPGFYLPPIIPVKLSYTIITNDTLSSISSPLAAMTNTVGVGLMSLIVSGPSKFAEKNNLLAFDFTQMTVKLLGMTVYSGLMRGGATSEAKFAQEKIANQAFFHYFLVTNKLIAARGRGGGLAIWGRCDQ